MVEKQRIPFSDYEEKPAKTGLKISNKNSPNVMSAEKFESKVTEYMQDKQERNKAVLNLAQQFMGIVKDKTLSENKSVMAKDVEQQVVSDLANAALAINQDDTEAEGMGSIALINLLFKVVISQRDRLNDLEYELVKVKKHFVESKAGQTSNSK